MKKAKHSIADIFIYIFIVAGIFFIAYVARTNFITDTGFDTVEEAIEQYYTQFATVDKEGYKKLVYGYTEENYNRLIATREAYNLKKSSVEKIFESEYEGTDAAMTPVFITFEMESENSKTFILPQTDIVLTIKVKGKWHVVELDAYPDGFEGWRAQRYRDFSQTKEFEERDKKQAKVIKQNQKFYDSAREKYSEMLGLDEE